VRKKDFFFFALIAGLALWYFAYPSASWRYRLTLEVETPEGMETGTGVIGVDVSLGPKVGDANTSKAQVTGQAVMVDLGERGLLFALLGSRTSVDYSWSIVFDLFPREGAGLNREGIDYYSSLQAEAEVPPAKLPMLVRFRDIADPRTVELVDPDDLAKSFGAGVRLKSASIEMADKGIWPLNRVELTGEPVTKGIEKLVPWIEQSNPIFVDWQDYAYDHPLRRVNKSVFTTRRIFDGN
jgi:hypothetical protein